MSERRASAETTSASNKRKKYITRYSKDYEKKI